MWKYTLTEILKNMYISVVNNTLGGNQQITDVLVCLSKEIYKQNQAYVQQSLHQGWETLGSRAKCLSSAGLGMVGRCQLLLPTITTRIFVTTQSLS